MVVTVALCLGLRVNAFYIVCYTHLILHIVLSFSLYVALGSSSRLNTHLSMHV